jgi:hypothetical protein
MQSLARRTLKLAQTAHYYRRKAQYFSKVVISHNPTHGVPRSERLKVERVACENRGMAHWETGARRIP